MKVSWPPDGPLQLPPVKTVFDTGFTHVKLQAVEFCEGHA
jgi:hypothetical protein